MSNRWCIGYGSLIDEQSARKTCPDIQSFQLIKLSGFKRIFGKVDPWGVHHDLVNWDTKEVADAYAIPDETFNTPMIVSVFEVPTAQWPSFQERECQYREYIETINIDSNLIEATIFIGYEDEESFRKERTPEYNLWPSFKDKYKGDIYRQEILPNSAYLYQCLEACKSHGEDLLNNFLETSFLADRKTNLRQYLENKESYL